MTGVDGIHLGGGAGLVIFLMTSPALAALFGGGHRRRRTDRCGRVAGPSVPLAVGKGVHSSSWIRWDGTVAGGRTRLDHPVAVAANRLPRGKAAQCLANASMARATSASSL